MAAEELALPTQELFIQTITESVVCIGLAEYYLKLKNANPHGN